MLLNLGSLFRESGRANLEDYFLAGLIFFTLSSKNDGTTVQKIKNSSVTISKMLPINPPSVLVSSQVLPIEMITKSMKG